jgi:DNA-binding transcriptional MerR regulator
MNDQKDGLTIEELAATVGVSVRTVRFYIAEGLIPGPGQRGKGTFYGAEHLLTLRLVRRLSEQRLPLAEIRDRLAGLSLAEVGALLEEEDRNEAERQQAEQGGSPKEYLSALLKQARVARQAGPPTPPAPFSLRESRAADWGALLSPSPPPAAPAQPPAPARPDAPTSAPSSAAAPAGESWQRLELAPGLELHVREDVGGKYRRLIERLLEVAGNQPRMNTDKH